MKKRGQNLIGKKAQIVPEEYFKIISIVLILAIALFFGNLLVSLYKGTYFQKVYLVRDIALTMSTVYAAPGELNYEYSNQRKSLEKFDFYFQRDTKSYVIIEEADSESTPLIYPYLGDEDLKNNLYMYKIEKPTKLQIDKQKNSLTVQK